MQEGLQKMHKKSNKKISARHISSRQDYFWGWLFVIPALSFFLLFIGFPAVDTFIGTFFSYDLLNVWNRQFVGLQNYLKLLEDPIFRIAVRNNLFFIILSIILQISIGLILAAILSRGVRKGSTIFKTIIFTPIVFSTVAVSLIWKLMYDPNIGAIENLVWSINDGLDGLCKNISFLCTDLRLSTPINGFLGEKWAIFSIIFVGSWQYTGYMMVILLAGMSSISDDLYEAAKMDGVSGLQAFFHITLPLLKNILTLCFLLTIIGAIKVYDQVYVLTLGGPGNASEVLGTYIYKNAFNMNQIGYANTLSMILLITALFLGILQWRISKQGG